MYQVIEETVAKLPKDAAALYRILGALPIQQVGAQLASVAMGVPAKSATKMLDQLAKAQLLAVRGPDVYELYPLVHEHAAEMSEEGPADERANALDRVTGWYLASAVNAAGTVRPYRRDVPQATTPAGVKPLAFDTRQDALDWLGDEAATILALARFLARSSDKRRAMHMLGQLWALWAYRKDYRMWEQCDALALGFARSLGDEDYKGRMLRRLALLCIEMGRYREALAFLEGAEYCFAGRITGYAGDARRRVGAVNSRGVALLRSGQVEQAVSVLEDALDSAMRLDDKRQMALIHLDLADAELERSAPLQAQVYLEAARRFLASPEDEFTLARIAMLNGRALGQSGESEPARHALLAATADMRKYESPTGEAEALLYLAELDNDTPNPERTRALTRAYRLLEDANAPQGSWLRVRIEELAGGRENVELKASRFS